jgi:hypothetical protein
MKKIIILATFLILLSTNGIGLTLAANNEKPTPKGLGISPLIQNEKEPSHFNYNLKPGQTIVDYMVISNFYDQDISVSLDATEKRVNQKGESFFTASNDQQNDIANWVTFPEKEVFIGKNQSKTVKFIIKIPIDAEEKDYVGGLSITQKNVRKISSGVMTNIRIVNSAYINISKNPTPIAKLIPSKPSPIYSYFLISAFITLPALSWLKSSKKLS